MVDVYNIPRYAASSQTRTIHRGIDAGSLGQSIYAAYGGVVQEKWTSYTIPGSFTSTCTLFQYYIKVCRIYHQVMNPITGNYATRPAYSASTPPSTPYLVSGQ